MPIVQISKMQHRAGSMNDLPQLDVGELGFATDENRLFIGNDPLLHPASGSEVTNTEVLTSDPNCSINGSQITGTITIDTGNLHISGGTNGYVLQTDGAGNVSWITIQGAGGIAAGANTQIQYNNGGHYDGSPNLTFNNTTNTLTVDNIIATGNLGVIGNFSAANVLGSGAGLTNLNGANLTGQVPNALIAGTVFSNAQPNITSVGALTSLTVSGNVSGSNVIVSGTTDANTSIGGSANGAVVVSGGAHITKNLNVGNGIVTGNILTSNLSTNYLGVSGNIEWNVGTKIFTENYKSSIEIYSSGPGWSELNYSNTQLAWTESTGVYIQANATGASKLWSFEKSGLFTAPGDISGANLTSSGNVTVTGRVSATGNVSGANIIASGNITGANITATGTLSVTNLSVTGNISAQRVGGDGGFLSNLAAANINGIVGRAAAANTATTRALTDNSSNIATTAFIHSYLPTNSIIMWYGSPSYVPTGWLLCDGSNGTPDLRDRFIIGAGGSYSTNSTGGSKDAVVVSHTHTGNSTSTVTDPGHNHSTFVQTLVSGTSGGPDPNWWRKDSSSTGSATTGISVATTTTIDYAGVDGTNKNLPPYYALCFIMKA